MKRFLRLAAKAILALTAVLIISSIIAIAYYWPIIDRLYIRPCYYYPNVFADCK